MGRIGSKGREAATPNPKPGFSVQISAPQSMGRYQDVFHSSASSADASETQSGVVPSSLQQALGGVQSFLVKNAKGAQSVLSGTVLWLENGVVEVAHWVATRLSEARAYVAAKVRQAWGTVKKWVSEALSFIRTMSVMTLLDHNDRTQNKKKKAEKRAEKKTAQRKAAAKQQASRKEQHLRQDAHVADLVQSAATDIARDAVNASDGTVSHVKMPVISAADALLTIDDHTIQQARERHLIETQPTP